MKMLDVIAATLLVVGGLNWGLWAAFEFDLVAALFGGSTAVLAKVVYGLVGLSAIYQAAGLPWIQKRWGVNPRLAAA
ncbi:MAG: DUF378 domain-containing protein [Phycisphaerales bacterium]|nr:DUF378 domain-containing protein [Phycisphaerales bacterium]